MQRRRKRFGVQLRSELLLPRANYVRLIPAIQQCFRLPIQLSKKPRRAMGWSLRTLILTMVLVGCGGGASDVLPVGFVNQTQHSVAELWTIWKNAQQNLAKNVDLNPLQRSFPGAVADIRPGDSRALRAAPHQIRVAGGPDAAFGAFFAVTSVVRTEPPRVVPCPPPGNG